MAPRVARPSNSSTPTTVVVAVLLAMVFLVQAEKSLLKAPLVIGHRGAPGYRPEETVGSYETAFEMGADFLEVDLCMSNDSVLVCRHDCTLGNTTNVASIPQFQSKKRLGSYGDSPPKMDWFIEDFTWEELQLLRAVERLPFTRPSNSMWDGLFPLLSLDEYLQEYFALEEQVPQTFHTLRQIPPASESSAEFSTCAGLLAQNPQVQDQSATALVYGKKPSVGLYIETKYPSYFRSIGLPMEETLLLTLNAAGFSTICTSPLPVDGLVCPIFLQSFEDNLKNFRNQTNYPLVQLVGAADEVQLDTNRTYSELMTDEGLDEIAKWANGIGPDKTWIIPETKSDNGTIITGEPTDLITRAHDRNLLVHPYTFRSDPYFLNGMFNNNPYLEYETFFNLGVDGVFSDFADSARVVRDCMFFPPPSSPVIPPAPDSGSDDPWNIFSSIGFWVLVAFIGVSLVVVVIVVIVVVVRKRKQAQTTYITENDDAFFTA